MVLLFLFEGGIKLYLQDNLTVCEPLEYIMLMSDFQEAKYFEFTDQILPPPKTFCASRKFRPPLGLFLVFIVIKFNN